MGPNVKKIRPKSINWFICVIIYVYTHVSLDKVGEVRYCIVVVHLASIKPNSNKVDQLISTYIQYSSQPPFKPKKGKRGVGDALTRYSLVHQLCI